MIINHNINALNAQRNLNQNIGAIQRSAESLASGLRINVAADDAAGLAVSERMRTQIRGLQQAARNTLDGISLIQTTEGFLAETTSILQRTRELSIQAANGIYTQTDREMIQVEINNLVQEIQRISRDSEFNRLPVLQGIFAGTGQATGAEGQVQPTGDGMVLHVGPNADQNLTAYIAEISAVSLQLASGGAAEAPLQNLDVSLDVVNEANTAISMIDSALDTVVKQRADLGAIQNRLEMTLQGINLSAENTQSAESRIRDADMAAFMVDYVKDSVLAQSSIAMVAQANMQPQMVLRLLG
jgi:flagellin